MMFEPNTLNSVRHGHAMDNESNMLTSEEFALLLTVGNTAFNEPPASITADHSARLIGCGYIADLQGRLRMTSIGRSRIKAGVDNRLL
jgi:hypothetical protein